MDLRDLWRGGLTLRRVGVLAKALPPESATMSALAADTDEAALAEPERPRRFSVDQHLAATLVDAVNAMHHSFTCAHSKRPPPRPIPLWRPGHAPRRRAARLTPAARERIRTRNRGGAHGR